MANNSTPARLGIIGGSGLYSMPDLAEVEEHTLLTPFGRPSAPIVTGMLEGRRVAFLARHGLGHVLTPGEINYRANIYALKSLGVERVVSVSACGSLREDFQPGQIVIPDQLFDFTKNRARSFFEGGLVAHVGVPDPFCPDLSEMVFNACRETGSIVHRGGASITIEGPRFSTRAESNVFRGWGMSIIGMTTSPEAFLAKEAELCYAVMAHVTDYDVWRVSEEPVNVEMILRTIGENLEHAQQAVRNLVKSWKDERECDCEQTMEKAFTTQRDRIPKAARKKLGILVDKYLD